jgi:acyl carrier protein
MEPDEFKIKLISFIQNICNASRPGTKVTEETKLFEGRLINSIRIIDIMSFIERELNISIPEEKLSMEFFQTPRVIFQSFITV